MVSEDEFIASCIARLQVHDRVLVGSGDDCAVLAHPDGRSVITTDTLVEGTHFRLDWSTARQVGERAAVQNMADIAAMGAAQHAATVALTLPFSRGEWVQEWAREFTLGFREVYEADGGALVGGDITSGPVIVATVTLVGDLQGRSPLLRSGARAGDLVVLAGQQGWSYAGWQLLDAGVCDVPADASDLERAALERAWRAFRSPRCPVAAGVSGSESGRLHALMDVSDGLVRDLGKICSASGVAAELSSVLLRERLAEFMPLRRWGVEPLECFLRGGEDHPLLGAAVSDSETGSEFCVSSSLSDRMETCVRDSCVPKGFAVIGVFRQGLDGAVYLDGERVSEPGFDHLVAAGGGDD